MSAGGIGYLKDATLAVNCVTPVSLDTLDSSVVW